RVGGRFLFAGGRAAEGSRLRQTREGRTTLPALMQLVHAWIRRGVPFTSARTRWMLGSQRRLIRLCEKVTDLPNHGFFPQMSHTAAIASTRVPGPYAAMAFRLACRASAESWPRT